jgi:hypothetical protein
MGTLYYAGQPAFDLPDRQLRHLQLAVMHKLRYLEHFALSWESETDAAGVTLWMSPAVPLRFDFTERKDRPANKAWVDAILATAVSGNMIAVPEPAEPEQPKG